MPRVGRVGSAGVLSETGLAVALEIVLQSRLDILEQQLIPRCRAKPTPDTEPEQ